MAVEATPAGAKQPAPTQTPPTPALFRAVCFGTGFGKLLSLSSVAGLGFGVEGLELGAVDTDAACLIPRDNPRS